MIYHGLFHCLCDIQLLSEVLPDVFREREIGGHSGSKNFKVCLLESVPYGNILCDAYATWRFTVRSGGETEKYSVQI